MSADSTSAYEVHAADALAARDGSSIGAGIATNWARSLVEGTDVLELGCGGGYPITRALIDAGLEVWAIDSSPTILAKFASRFPEVPIECSNVLEADFFGRRFGAAISVGLVFLLNPEEQSTLIHRVATVLDTGGRFLFTAPIEVGSWADMTTGHKCCSLGREQYEAILTRAGFRISATYEDQGRNNYYAAEKIQEPAD